MDPVTMILFYLTQTIRLLYEMIKSTSKDSTQSKIRPPGTLLARTSKNVRALIDIVVRCNKLKGLQDLLGMAKKIKDFPTRPGEVAVMTGATRGIGLDVLKKLLQCDFKVIMGIRDLGAGERAIKQLRDAGVSTGSAVILTLDLKSLKSVRNFAEKVLKETERIDLLINNAGIMFTPYETTEDGYECHFQVNYLSHFLLTNLLLPKIRDTSTKKKVSCRIVNVSSDVNFGGNLDFTDLEVCKTYAGLKAYCDSKFAQVVHAKYLDKLMSAGGYNVRAYAIHPGTIPSNLWIHLGPLVNRLRSYCLESWFKTSDDGANVVMFGAMSPELENDGGAYINNCEKVRPNYKSEDANLQKLLWERSKQLSETVRTQ